MTFKVTTPVTAQTPGNPMNTDVEMQSAEPLQGSPSGDVIMRPGLVGLFGLPQGPTYRGGAHPVWHNIAADTAH
jgi:hypothetical protein